MTSLYITLRESIEFSIILLLLISTYKEHKKTLVASALFIIVAGILITWLNYPISGFLRKAYTGFMFYSFIMVLLLSFIADRKVIFPVAAIVFMLFIPSAQLTSVVMEEASLKGANTFINASAGMLATAFIFALSLRFLSKLNLERFFGTDGIMVFLSSFCFVFGGLNEFDHSSIITSLQRGIYIFLSSFIPFIKGILLIPDGRMITTALDSILDYLSSQRVAMAVTAFILFIPPLYVFISLLITPEPVTEGVEKKAERRKIIAVYVDELFKKGTPLLIALLVSIVLLHSANLAIRPTYEPEPLPVMADGDVITVPLIGKFGDISDGRMRKYSFLHQGETYRFIVMMRPDGEVVAVLDACEICPPRGYVQRGEHVICKYCNTPIPLQSLGQPGGCNPIPVNYRVKDDNLTLNKSEIVDAYKKEAGKETGSVLR